MILGPDGSKLSKRHGDVSVDALRARGFLPEAVVNGLALLGWSDVGDREFFTPGELVERFDLARVNKAAAIFDEAKLRHLNREHMKTLPDEALARAFSPYLVAAKRLPRGEMSSDISSWMADLSALIRERVEVLSDAVPASDPIFVFEPEQMEQDCWTDLAQPRAKEVLAAFALKAEEEKLSAPGVFKAAVGSIKDALGVKGKALFHPIRLGLTGSSSGPDLDRLASLLQRGSTLALPTPVLSPSERARRILSLLEKR
jgi:nondiscriminating glutamyl-tRNA synthetase